MEAADRAALIADLPTNPGDPAWLDNARLPSTRDDRVGARESEEVSAGDYGIVIDSPILDRRTGRMTPDSSLLEMIEAQWQGICLDHVEFYSADGVGWLVVGLGAGALMANTSFDRNIVRDAYVDNIILAPNDELYEKVHEAKFLGDGWYTIPVFAVAALSEPLVDELPLGQPVAEWGQRSLRTILVGGPPMLGLQLLTGASRPGETSAGSHWKPLQDNNGVSGHSFMGAIPFMSAAKMTDNVWLKGGLYAVSTLPALSRLNDDHHYFSQAFLGWWLAYLAETAVDRAHDPGQPRRFSFGPDPTGTGLAIEFRH